MMSNCLHQHFNFNAQKFKKCKTRSFSSFSDLTKMNYSSLDSSHRGESNCSKTKSLASINGFLMLTFKIHSVYLFIVVFELFDQIIYQSIILKNTEDTKNTENTEKT